MCWSLKFSHISQVWMQFKLEEKIIKVGNCEVETSEKNYGFHLEFDFFKKNNIDVVELT